MNIIPSFSLLECHLNFKSFTPNNYGILDLDEQLIMNKIPTSVKDEKNELIFAFTRKDIKTKDILCLICEFHIFPSNRKNIDNQYCYVLVWGDIVIKSYHWHKIIEKMLAYGILENY
jgi:hypothetical protein